MKRSEIISNFTDMHNMHLIGGRGDFAISPDEGRLRRIFLADIKRRFAGTILLGVIGFQIHPEQKPEGRPLELSAYITNFEEFMHPPIMEIGSATKDWISLIANTLLSFPISSDGIAKSRIDGRIANLSLDPFLSSSPEHLRFFECVRSADYG